MADIQERIKNTGAFFSGMQVTKVDDADVIYVIVHFPPKWIIDDTVKEKYEVSVIDGKTDGEYLFCAEMAVGFDAVFDAIDHCVAVNRDAAERAQIFQDKIKELKEIFGNEENSIKKLKTLEFTFSKQKRETNKKKTPVEEVAEKELDIQNNETEQ